MSASRPPRRFRFRLLAVLLAAGPGPLLVWGLLGSAGRAAISLALSPPVGPVLERASGTATGDAALAEELRQARRNVAQAELVRRALVQRTPIYLVGALVLSAVFLAGAAFLLGRSLARPSNG